MKKKEKKRDVTIKVDSISRKIDEGTIKQIIKKEIKQKKSKTKKKEKKTQTSEERTSMKVSD